MSDPTFDDLADTITANLRTMKDTAVKMEQLQITVHITMMMIAVILGVLMITLYSKAKK